MDCVYITVQLTSTLVLHGCICTLLLWPTIWKFIFIRKNYVSNILQLFMQAWSLGATVFHDVTSTNWVNGSTTVFHDVTSTNRVNGLTTVFHDVTSTNRVNGSTTVFHDVTSTNWVNGSTKFFSWRHFHQLSKWIEKVFFMTSLPPIE